MNQHLQQGYESIVRTSPRSQQVGDHAVLMGTLAAEASTGTASAQVAFEFRGQGIAIDLRQCFVDADLGVDETLSKIDGDALAAEFERYLRRRGPGGRFGG